MHLPDDPHPVHPAPPPSRIAPQPACRPSPLGGSAPRHRTGRTWPDPGQQHSNLRPEGAQRMLRSPRIERRSPPTGVRSAKLCSKTWSVGSAGPTNKHYTTATSPVPDRVARCRPDARALDQPPLPGLARQRRVRFQCASRLERETPPETESGTSLPHQASHSPPDRTASGPALMAGCHDRENQGSRRVRPFLSSWISHVTGSGISSIPVF